MYLLAKGTAKSLSTSTNQPPKRALTITIGLAALVLGAFVYLVDRNPSSVYFIPAGLSQWKGQQSVFGVIGNFLPTFVHPFAFICLSAAFIELNKRNIVLTCLAWLFIDSVFELVQMTVVAQYLLGIIPSFSGIPILENTHNYLLHGSFDVFDLFSIVLGTIAAYFTLTHLTLTHFKPRRRS